MPKAIKIVLLSILFLLTIPINPVFASLVYIDNSGDVTVNVLSNQIALGASEKVDLEVTGSAGGRTGSNNIAVKKEDGKIVLNVGDDTQLDVTDWQDNLIEIEERANVRKISILLKDNRFVINQSNVSAYADFPIYVNPKENELTIETSSGSANLSILPLEAVEIALRAKNITNFFQEGVLIEEREHGILSYKISGEKQVDILNIMTFQVPVTTYISTTTGEVLDIDQPKWLSLFGFLFS